MKTEAMTTLRTVLKAFCPTGAESEAVTVPQIAEAMGLETESQRQVIRKQLSELAARGEVKKIDRGLFLLTGKEATRQGESFKKMWRAVRLQQRKFTICEIAQLTRVNSSTVGHYLQFLMDEGFITFHGREKNAKIYKLTPAGAEQQKTPFPPLDIPDPYKAERAACAGLCRIMLMENLELASVRNKICEHLNVLNNTFNQNENTGETL